MAKLFIAKTYFLERDRLTQEKLTAVSDDFYHVERYIGRIRGLPIITERELDAIPDSFQTVCIVEEASFPSSLELTQYLNQPEIQPFILEDFGKIDHIITGLTKKESKHIFIPRIVIDIIERKIDQFKTELKMSNHILKELLFYINGYDKSRLKVNRNSINLMATCKLLDRLVADEGYELSGDMYNRSPVLFCEEHEYRSYIDTELGHRELDEAYRDAIAYQDD